MWIYLREIKININSSSITFNTYHVSWAIRIISGGCQTKLLVNVSWTDQFIWITSNCLYFGKIAHIGSIRHFAKRWIVGNALEGLVNFIWVNWNGIQSSDIFQWTSWWTQWVWWLRFFILGLRQFMHRILIFKCLVRHWGPAIMIRLQILCILIFESNKRYILTQLSLFRILIQ